MLELETDLIRRIRDEVPGFKTVGNPSVMAGLHDIGELLPACIVVPGHGDLTVTATGDPALHVIEEQNWDVVVIIPHQYDEATDAQTEDVASGFMKQVFAAIHGWKSERGDMRSGYIYQGRPAPLYNIGWGEFPMTFNAKRIINGRRKTD